MSNSTTNPTLRNGSSGDSVRFLQILLNNKGFNLSNDGIFGPLTEAAVITWQKNLGLKTDGIVGPLTWSSILPPTIEADTKPSEQFSGLTTFSLRKDGETNISTNFKVNEFRSKCGANEIIIDVTFIKDKLQKIKDEFGKVDITSAYRTLSHNNKVGGSKTSRHMVGDAIDFSIRGVPLLTIAKYAEKLGINGIIIYRTKDKKDRFIHIDNRKTNHHKAYNDAGIIRKVANF